MRGLGQIEDIEMSDLTPYSEFSDYGAGWQSGMDYTNPNFDPTTYSALTSTGSSGSGDFWQGLISSIGSTFASTYNATHAPYASGSAAPPADYNQSQYAAQSGTTPPPSTFWAQYGTYVLIGGTVVVVALLMNRGN